MSQIFDRFPTEERARAFAQEVRGRFQLGAQVYTDLKGALAADPFPFELDPPIVHVNRADPKLEERVQQLVIVFGGEYAGT